MKNRCLYCYNPLEDNEIDYHSKCSKEFFGMEKPPELSLSLSDINKYAVEMLQRSVVVTGVQPKLSLDLKKEKDNPPRLTIVGLWGQYILKPPHSDYPEMPELEDLTMKLSEGYGINTASHSLIRMKSGELAYINKRFDRTASGKLHMEDFAQILELMTERKYNSSIEKIGKAILKYSSFPGNDVINLFEIILFCFFTGNSDMHLKNFSLLRDEYDDIKLSPAYDLLAVKLLLPADKEETALTINGKKSHLRKNDFNTLADRFGINEKSRNSIYNRFTNVYNDWEKVINKSFITGTMKEKYISLIKSRMEQIGLLVI
ncbi:MAG: HipA domain-containing protein [Melioribacteraceae bacterium]